MGSAERTTRNDEITTQYFAILDKHLAELVSGKVTEMMRLNQIVNELMKIEKEQELEELPFTFNEVNEKEILEAMMVEELFSAVPEYIR